MNGYAEALLIGLDMIAQENAPANKVTPPGFLSMVIENGNKPEVIRVDSEDGHRKNVRIKYQKRGVVGNTSTDPSCDINVVPVYNEVNAAVNGYRQIAIYIPDDVMAQYESATSAMESIGQMDGSGPAKIMREHLMSLLRQLNGMYQGIDSDLLTQMAVSFGTNVNTGDNLVKAINLPKQVNIQSLTDGIFEILKDYEENEGVGSPLIVGSGLFHSYNMQQFAKSADQFGINTAAAEKSFKFYYDRLCASKFGANQIGVFEPNALQMIDYNRYKGSFAGQRGTSFFGTLTDPRIQPNGAGGINSIDFDFQLKYFDCPTTALVGGVSQTIDNGYVLIVSKHFGLFTMPNDAYDAADPLTGNNGTYRYGISNNCDTCG